MPSISELTMYPIKSCAGIALTEAVITASGLSYAGVCDREWMLVDESGLFLTQREYPRMACLRITIAGDTLRVDTDAMATLSISLKANADAQKSRSRNSPPIPPPNPHYKNPGKSFRFSGVFLYPNVIMRGG